MRLALLLDLHGNPIAVEAVLADVEECGGVDAYLVLGDIVAIGHDPIAVLERLVALPGVRFIQGNTDRYVVTGQRPYPSLADVESDPGLIARLVEVAHSFAWTKGMVTAAGWFNWFSALHLEERMLLPEGPVCLPSTWRRARTMDRAFIRRSPMTNWAHWSPKRRPISCVSDIRTGRSTGQWPACA